MFKVNQMNISNISSIFIDDFRKQYYLPCDSFLNSYFCSSDREMRWWPISWFIVTNWFSNFQFLSYPKNISEIEKGICRRSMLFANQTFLKCLIRVFIYRYSEAITRRKAFDYSKCLTPLYGRWETVAVWVLFLCFLKITNNF